MRKQRVSRLFTNHTIKMTWFSFLILFSFFASSSLTAFIYFQNPESRLSQAFSFFLATVSYWAFTEFMERHVLDLRLVAFWDDIGSIWLLTVSALLYFILVYTENKLAENKLLFYSIFTVGTVLSGIDFYIIRSSHYQRVWWGWKIIYDEESIRNLSNLTIIGGSIISVIAIILCVRYWHKTKEPAKKDQAKLVSFGLGIIVFIGVLSEGILPLATSFSIPPLTVCSVIPASLFIGYGIWKHELFLLTPEKVARTIIDTMGEALFLCDENNNIIDLNNYAKKLLHCSAASLKGKSIHELVTDRLPQLPIPESFESNTLFIDYFETNLKTKHGDPIAVLCAISAFFGHKRIPNGFIYNFRDISELKKAQKELQKINASLVQFKAAIEQSIDGIVVIDMEGIVLFANHAWARMRDCSVSEIEGQHIKMFNSSGHWEQEVALLHKKALEGTGFETEISHKRKDGTEIPIWISVAIQKDRNNNPISFVGIARDITERKKAEKKVEEANRKMIDAAHRAGMAEIASETLHNVGNLLNSVKTSAQNINDVFRNSSLPNFFRANSLLRENIDNIEHFIVNDSKGKKLLEYYLMLEQEFTMESKQIREDTLRLIRKVNMIADVVSAQNSYVGFGSYTENYSLAILIEDALKLVPYLPDQLGITITKKFEEVPTIKIQKTKLIHILINLINNARDSMLEKPMGNRNLEISLRQENDFAIIQVKDNGVGIDKKNIPRIFTHGFTTKKDGHGFGLHSSANYIAEMNGSIWVENNIEESGASFFLKLPIG
ncbi:PAS domain S-box protein [bacterium]|nr:PAS domain S-box protein [bacterium]